MAHTNANMIRFFSTLADETRLTILLSLTEGKKTVNEIHEAVGKEKLTLSAVSHQLKDMANMDMIVFKRQGRNKIFQLSNGFCWCILKDAFKHFHDEKKCPACTKLRKQNDKKVAGK